MRELCLYAALSTGKEGKSKKKKWLASFREHMHITVEQTDASAHSSLMETCAAVGAQRYLFWEKLGGFLEYLQNIRGRTLLKFSTGIWEAGISTWRLILIGQMPIVLRITAGAGNCHGIMQLPLMLKSTMAAWMRVILWNSARL